MSIAVLNNKEYPNDTIKRWVLSQYKNYLIRNKKEVDSNTLNHIIDFFMSDDCPKNLEVKSAGSIIKMVKRWDKKKLKANNDLIKEMLVWENGPYKVFKLLSKEALIEEGNIMKNCIGKSSKYENGLLDGSSVNYSLRKGSDRLVNIEVDERYDDINQAIGPKNERLKDKDVILEVLSFVYFLGGQKLLKKCENITNHYLVIDGDRKKIYSDLLDLIENAKSYHFDYFHSNRFEKDIVLHEGISIGVLCISDRKYCKEEKINIRLNNAKIKKLRIESDGNILKDDVISCDQIQIGENGWINKKVICKTLDVYGENKKNKSELCFLNLNVDYLIVCGNSTKIKSINNKLIARSVNFRKIKKENVDISIEALYVKLENSDIPVNAYYRIGVENSKNFKIHNSVKQFSIINDKEKKINLNNFFGEIISVMDCDGLSIKHNPIYEMTLFNSSVKTNGKVLNRLEVKNSSLIFKEDQEIKGSVVLDNSKIYFEKPSKILGDLIIINSKKPENVEVLGKIYEF